MKIEEQVLSIDQIQYLKELGLKVEDTAIVWYKDNPIRWIPRINKGKTPFNYDYIPTLTLQEILEMLPEEIKFEGQRAYLIIDKSERMISYTAENYIDCMFFGNENLLQAAYKMLCWCLKQGHIKNE